MKTIKVMAAETSEQLDDAGAVVESTWETVKEAKAQARHYVSEAFARAAELSTPLGYARVVVDGENVFDVEGAS